MKYKRLQYCILLQSANIAFQISRPRLMISEYHVKYYYIHFILQHHVTARCEVSDHRA